MAYGSSTWNSSIVAKNYKYIGYDNNGFLHGSNSSKNLESILKSYNSAIDYSVVNSFKNATENGNVDFLNSAKAVADANNERYEQYYKRTQDFNSAEAEKNRQFQLEMSSTAHQREVEDLQKAGLNPILSVNAGASTGSGSAASSPLGQVDTSLTGALAGIYTTMLNNATALKQTQMNNDAQIFMNNASLTNAKQIAELQASVSKYGADVSASANRYGADVGYQGKIDTSLFGQLIDAIKGFTGSDKPSQSFGEILGDQVSRLTNPDNWKTYKNNSDKHGTSKGSKK